MNGRESMIVMASRALEAWSEWMESPSDLRALWYPGKSAGFATGGINCYDDLEDGGAAILAQAIGQIVEELPLIQKSAIYHHYLATVWRAREGVLEQALEDGTLAVAKAMVVRGVG